MATEPRKVSWWARSVFAAVAIGAFVFGIVGFHQYLKGNSQYGHGFLDLSYYSLQLFVLDAAPLQNATHLGDWPLLQIARFAAPLVTVYLIILATQALIFGRLQQARISWLRHHSILCGPPELTRELADQILGEDGGQVIVVSPEPDRPTVRGRELHVTGDPRRASTLTRAGLRRAREVITVGPDTIHNAEVAIAVHTVNQEKKSKVVCYAEAHDRELFEAVVRQEIGSGRVDAFSRHDQTARGLLDHLPPVPPSAVLVIGYTDLGRTLVDRLMQFWSGPAVPVKPSLCVLDPNVPETSVKQRYRGNENRVIVTARDLDPRWLISLEDLKVRGADGVDRIPGRIYVCLADDAAAIEVGNAALRLLAGSDCAVVVAVSHSRVLGQAAVRQDAAAATPLRPVLELEKAKLVLVSVPRTVYSIAAIRTGTNEALARAIHQDYLDEAQKRGDTPESNQSAVPWEQLRPYLQDSNREQAWDIGHKLKMIGCTPVQANGEVSPELTPEQVLKLARAEHVRWMEERTAQGWRPGKARDNKNKTHPDLVDWSNLSEESREKDLATVRAIPKYLKAAGLTMVKSA